MLAVVHLEIEAEILEGWSDVLVPPAVVDEIELKYAMLVSQSKPAITIAKQEEAYVRHEVSGEALEQVVEFVRRAREFAKRAKAATSHDLLDPGNKERVEVLGKHAVAAVLAASDNGGVLYSDDRVLRDVARSWPGVDGAWTQSVLRVLLHKEVIDVSRYREVLGKMALGNFDFLSINAEDVLWHLRRDDWKPTEVVEQLFRRLRGPECSESSALVVVADVLRQLWLEATLTSTRLAVVQVAMESFVAGRAVFSVVQKLKTAVRVRLRLAPTVAMDVEGAVDSWLREYLRSRPVV